MYSSSAKFPSHSSISYQKIHFRTSVSWGGKSQLFGNCWHRRRKIDGISTESQ
ncbi:hypothetical protein PHET_11064 [Paragonimus heterotremus]|uniref:Uncharacterized protein n=1 Tax=Paragonimus heterotremus TaxID=100268 RepID=A0A8J4T5V3_9TREM|nr:hypothetical protein PHET_11064 [Paragonimus heterotremus]